MSHGPEDGLSGLSHVQLGLRILTMGPVRQVRLNRRFWIAAIIAGLALLLLPVLLVGGPFVLSPMR
jgi:hypothetical protein